MNIVLQVVTITGKAEAIQDKARAVCSLEAQPPALTVTRRRTVGDQTVFVSQVSALMRLEGPTHMLSLSFPLSERCITYILARKQSSGNPGTCYLFCISIHLVVSVMTGHEANIRGKT